MEAGISITVKRALTPQRGWFSGLWLYAYAQPVCGMCIWQGRLSVLLCPRESRRAVWAGGMGNLGAAESKCRRGAGAGLRKPAARHYRGVHGLGNGSYQPAEASACLTQRCLAVLHSHPVDWLVVQTRSLLVQRDFVLLAELPFATLNVTSRNRPPGGASTFYTLLEPRLSGA